MMKAIYLGQASFFQLHTIRTSLKPVIVRTAFPFEEVSVFDNNGTYSFRPGTNQIHYIEKSLFCGHNL